MLDRERDSGLREAGQPRLRRPRFLVSRHQAALLVVLGYAVVVGLTALLLRSLEVVQHIDDHRNIDAVWIFAGMMAIPLIAALYGIYRRARMPDWPA